MIDDKYAELKANLMRMSEKSRPQPTVLYDARNAIIDLQAANYLVQESMLHLVTRIADLEKAKQLAMRNRELEASAEREARTGLKRALNNVLDNIDFTAGACSLTSMVGAALPVEAIKDAREALKISKDLDLARIAAAIDGEHKEVKE